MHSLSGAAASGLLWPCANSWDAGSSYWADSLIQVLTEESHMVYMYTYLFPLAHFHPEQPEGSRVRLLVQFVFLLVLFVSVLICVASCVNMFLCEFYKGVCRRDC